MANPGGHAEFHQDARSADLTIHRPMREQYLVEMVLNGAFKGALRRLNALPGSDPIVVHVAPGGSRTVTELAPSDLPEDAISLAIDGYEVASWSPGKLSENLPPTQVHFVLSIPSIEAKFVLRLKSARAVDELISTLQERRNFVFKDAP